jgi:RNA polymerase sigma-70 factor (ECF subfamily)
VEPTDQDLVRTALEGPDPEAHRAFEAIVDRWKAPVYRFLRSRIRHDTDAEDAAADTFVEAWRSLPGLRDPGKFGSWLLRIAWTRAIAWYEGRGMRAELTLVEQALLDERVAYAPIPLQDDLRDALSEMPADQLGLLLDKYETKMTYQEIAARDGIAVSTVRDRLVEARDRMARILQRRGLLEEFAEEIERRRRQRREQSPPGAARG